MQNRRNDFGREQYGRNYDNDDRSFRGREDEDRGWNESRFDRDREGRFGAQGGARGEGTWRGDDWRNRSGYEGSYGGSNYGGYTGGGYNGGGYNGYEGSERGFDGGYGAQTATHFRPPMHIRSGDDRGFNFGSGFGNSWGSRSQGIGGQIHPNDWNAGSFALDRRFDHEGTYGNRNYAGGGLGQQSQGQGQGAWTQSHRGKGPKGFRRSDERIKEQVCEALADHDEIDASEIDVSVKDGEVTLTGTIDDRRTKYLVAHVVDGLSGVEDVHNNLRVRRDVQNQAGQNGPQNTTLRNQSAAPQQPRNSH